jgi:4-amino-4-deoxy-L-arabinose transferase-like glycosyltransferase
MEKKSNWYTQTTIILLVIIGIALTLRIYGIWFGLPYALHDDEPNEILRALQLGSGSFNYDRVGKGGYFYLLFFEYGILFIILKVSGIVQSATDFAEYYISDPTVFYLIGRSTTAIIGSINVYLVYRIGTLSYSASIGLVAALLLAVNLLHAQLSHYVTVDVPMVCLATASLLYSIRMLRSQSARNYYLAALFAALATTTKMPAILLVIPLTIAHFFHEHNRPSGVRGYFLNRRLWGAATIFLSVYVALTPGIIVNFAKESSFVLGLLGFGGDVESLQVDVTDAPALASKSNLFKYYALELLKSMTLPVFILSLFGITWSIWKRRSVDIVLLSFATSVYLIASVSSSTDLVYARYILPIIPVVSILTARFLSESTVIIFSRSTSQVVALVACVIALIPAVHIVQADIHMLKPDTRIVAKDWIDENIPSGSRIFIEGATVRPYEQTVPLKYSRDNLLRAIEYFRESEPGKARYFELELRTLGGATFDLVTVAPDKLRSVQHYKDSGVQYLILRPLEYLRSSKRVAWPAFVQEVRDDPDIFLLKTIEPNGIDLKGPHIEIYQVNSKHTPR